MDFIIKEGDTIIYNGEIHLRKYLIWKSLYKHLKKGESYKVERIFTNEECYIYYKLKVNNGLTWYPKESFFVDKRRYCIEKYKLK